MYICTIISYYCVDTNQQDKIGMCVIIMCLCVVLYENEWLIYVRI